MGQFRSFLNCTGLKEIHLGSHLFTWSNERLHPTLERIDRAFISREWDELYPQHDLQALSTICSDHAPLLLHTNNMWSHKRFHFLAYWSKFPEFLEVVEHTWHCSLVNADPCHRLDWLFHNTARALKTYSDHHISNIRMQLEVAKEVVYRMEMAQDRRVLATHEADLRRFLKLKALALSSLQRTLARQESRILWLREGVPQ
jgi:hypothetical protein